MSENIIPVPYKIRCRDCVHPAKYHTIDGCHLKECKCTSFNAEELEFEHCIDSLSGKEICVQCSTDKNLKNGLCERCTKFQPVYDELKKKHPKWNNRKLRDTADKRIDAKKES